MPQLAQRAHLSERPLSESAPEAAGSSRRSAVAVPYRGAMSGQSQGAVLRRGPTEDYSDPMVSEGTDELKIVRHSDYFVSVVPGKDFKDHDGALPREKIGIGETIFPEALHIDEWLDAMLTGSCGGEEIFPNVWNGGCWWDRTCVVQWRDGSIGFYRAGMDDKFDLFMKAKARSFCERALLLYDLEAIFNEVNDALKRAVIRLPPAVAEDALKRAVKFLRTDMRMKMLKMIEKSSASFKGNGFLVEQGTGYCGVDCCKNWKRHDLSERWMLQLLCHPEDPDDVFAAPVQPSPSKCPLSPIPDSASPHEQELAVGSDFISNTLGELDLLNCRPSITQSGFRLTPTESGYRLTPIKGEKEEASIAPAVAGAQKEAESPAEQEEAARPTEQEAAERSVEQDPLLELLETPPMKKQKKTKKNHVERV